MKLTKVAKVVDGYNVYCAKSLKVSNFFTINSYVKIVTADAGTVRKRFVVMPL